MQKQQEPTVLTATVRGADENDVPAFHIECRLSDGQKGAFIVVDGDFPELAANVAASLGVSRREREARLLERASEGLGADLQAELKALANAYRSGEWNPWVTPAVAAPKPVVKQPPAPPRPEADGIEVARPGMLIGLGTGQQVSQLLKIRAVHAGGFMFDVINGGWGGEWRAADNMLRCGNVWRPGEIVFVQTSSETLRGSYAMVMAHMEKRLAEGYCKPRLVLPPPASEPVEDNPDAARFDDAIPY